MNGTGMFAYTHTIKRLTQYSRLFLENLTVAEMLKKFLAFDTN